MKLLFLILLVFSISNLIYSQETDTAEKVLPVIYSLNFPYNDGYQLVFQGKNVVFDKYNFPKETTKKSMQYSFYPYKNNIKKLLLYFFEKKDTTKFQTFLMINDKGLSYWLDDDSLKKKEKHQTMAIPLPLYTGKKWNTWFNDLKSTAECLSTDTIIMTHFGEKSVFGIRFNFQEKGKKINRMPYCYEVTEFYDPVIGKVYSRCTQYLYDKENDKKIKLFEDEYYLVDYYNLNDPAKIDK